MEQALRELLAQPGFKEILAQLAASDLQEVPVEQDQQAGQARKALLETLALRAQLVPESLDQPGLPDPLA